MRNILSNITIGTAGGALIEGVEEGSTLIQPALETATGSGDPIELIKIITQLVIALATVISLFVKPKLKKDRPQDSLEGIPPRKTLDVD